MPLQTRIIQNNIGWCDDTGNIVTGCSEKGDDCANCYAREGTRARVLRHRDKIETWGPHGVRYPVKNFEPHLAALNRLCLCDKCHEAQKWIDASWLGTIHREPSPTDHIGCDGTHRRIRFFADSNSDWLDPKWDVPTRERFLQAIISAENVDVQILTKNAEHWKNSINAVQADPIAASKGNPPFPELHNYLMRWCHGKAPSNLWIGGSAGRQKHLDRRLPDLEKIPARIRFLSLEPLLEPITLPDRVLRPDGAPVIHWVIVGGESGLNRRPVDVNAIVNLAHQCESAVIPVYVKQDSLFLSGQQGRIPDAIWSLKQFPNHYAKNPESR